jgi:VanZ family protein
MKNDSSDEPQRPSRQKSRVTLVVLLFLCVYWGAIFYGTHMKLAPNALPGNSDKLLHFGAFLGLGVLFMTLRATRGPFSWPSLLGRWLVLISYAIFDEYTQSLVGRDAEVYDWLADTLGSFTGLMLVALFCWNFLDLKKKPVAESSQST